MSRFQLVLVLFEILPMVVALDKFENNPYAEKCPVDRCPLQWKLWNGSCYRLLPENQTWGKAKQACREMGGFMAAPRSLEENGFFFNTAKGAGLSTEGFWIDCSDIEEEGEWICEGRADPFLNWRTDGPTEPNGASKNEDCVAIRLRNGGEEKWMDISCDTLYPAMCKWASPGLYCFTTNAQGRLDDKFFGP